MWQRLKLLRKVYKKTIQSMALAACISESYYTQIENGECEFPLPVDVAQKIAAVLGFDWELFYAEPTYIPGDKLPYFIRYTGVDRKTGEEKKIHPKDAPNPERFDGFAAAFGYR